MVEKLTVRQVAERTNRDLETVRRWIRSGRLPATKTLDGLKPVWTVDADDLHTFLTTPPKGTMSNTISAGTGVIDGVEYPITLTINATKYITLPLDPMEGAMEDHFQVSFGTPMEWAFRVPEDKELPQVGDKLNMQIDYKSDAIGIYCAPVVVINPTPEDQALGARVVRVQEVHPGMPNLMADRRAKLGAEKKETP